MFEFDAHFYGTKIFIGGKKEYKLGEILERYLSKKFKELDEIHQKCKCYVGLLHYPEDISEVDNCDSFFQGAICFYDKMDDLILLFRLIQTEFQQWADFALEIREKALNGEIEFEEYVERIKV